MASTAKQVKFEKTDPTNEDKQANSSDANQTNRTAKKEYRKRMKGLLSGVKKQMEFYFGDANVNKDRFMKQQIASSPDGYLPISLFLTFHKIQKLTDSKDIIVKALEKSDMLAVSDDKTKVYRTRPVWYMTEEEVDARTVYVEGLPKHADHDWISSHFLACGKVTYVSLPRYRHTGDIKGFAFVEFEMPEEAAKAVEMMNKEAEEETEHGKLSQSVKTLKNLKYWRNRAIKEGLDPDKQVTEEAAGPCEEKGDKKASKKQKKRKRRTSDALAEENQQTAKKAKVDTADGEAVQTSSEDNCGKNKDLSKDNPASTAHTGKAEETKEGAVITSGVGQQQESSKRKRKLENRSDKQTVEETTSEVSRTADEVDIEPAEKTTKQKENSGASEHDPKRKKQKGKQAGTGRRSLDQTDLKECGEPKKRKRKSLDKGEGEGSKKPRKDPAGVSDKTPASTPGKKSKRKKKKKTNKEPFRLRVMSKVEWIKLKREYLDQQRTSMASLKQQLKGRHAENRCPAPVLQEVPAEPGADAQQATAAVIRSAPEFIPDVIVEITSETGMFYKQLKEQIDPSVSVAYVDVKDNQLSGHIRCKDADSAQKLAAADIPRCKLTLVQGEAEKAYWDKMVRDRESKLCNAKRKKKRGAAKLLDRAQTATMESMQKNHILFDED